MVVKIPFSIFPAKLIFPLARRFLIFGDFLNRAYPPQKLFISQANLDVTTVEFNTMALIASIINTVFIFLLTLGIGIIARQDTLTFAIAVCVLVFFATFSSSILYPKVLATKRIRSLDANIIPALQHLLIELKSGVTLFQAMTSVTSGYGEVSLEFKRISDKISTGSSQTEALNEASNRIPSFKFKRALWQISNSLTAGSDIVGSLEDMVKELTNEKIDDIRRYGQELNPWTMMYMMFTVILPSLGVTTMGIFLSFLSISIPKIVLPGLIVFLILFQLFFMNFIKSRRPLID